MDLYSMWPRSCAGTSPFFVGWLKSEHIFNLIGDAKIAPSYRARQNSCPVLQGSPE
jgi:hypothetical protein